MRRTGIGSLEFRAALAASVGVRARAVGIMIVFVLGVLAPLGLAPLPVQGTEHCTADTLPPNDDASTELVDIGFTIDFFGTDYSALYVNNNGNVTFTAPLPEFTPEPIVGAATPIIAPFWADVDTRAAGSAAVTFAQITVGDRDAFCVAWEGVGYFNTHDDKLNGFELLLIDRSDVAAGDFDIVFTYSQVQWETGDASGGTDGLGGSSARAGYSNGEGSTPATSLELPGSAVNGAFLDSNLDTGLIHNSRGSDVSGTYVFPVRNGSPPEPTHPLDVTLAGDGSGSVSSDPAGIDCPETCSTEFADGTPVTLTATADPGSTFAGWSGDCDGNEACPLTMSEARSVTATFDAESEASADLSVTQTDEPDPVTAGNGVQYLLTVTNDGPDPATEVTLVDAIPDGSTLVAADTPGCSVVSDTVVCDLGTLAPQASTTVSIVVNSPLSSSPTTMTNNATVTGAESDPNPADNTSTEVTSVEPAPANRDTASGWISSEGGTVATGAGGGPSKRDPMTTAVTVPPGVEGLVTIVEGPITFCPAGYRCFGQEADITAPTASADDPLRLTFRYHPSSLTPAPKLANLVMFHDNVLVPRCSGASGIAAPDPCIASVAKVKGNIQIVVLTSENGSWRGGR